MIGWFFSVDPGMYRIQLGRNNYMVFHRYVNIATLPVSDWAILWSCIQ